MSASLVKPCLQRASLSPIRRVATLRRLHSSPRWAEQYVNPSPETFRNLVKTDSRVVLVDFYADWCKPCHQLSPVLEKLTAAPNKSGSGHPLDLVKIDVDSEEHVPLALEFKVRAMPTVVAFRNGQMIDSFVGAQPPDYIKGFLSRL